MNGIHEVRGSIPLGSTKFYFSAVSNLAPTNDVFDDQSGNVPDGIRHRPSVNWSKPSRILALALPSP